MGIAANQARILALTARKCDLETQMQLILNNKLNIAKQTADIANVYNSAISNRKLFVFNPGTANAPQVDAMTPANSQYQSINAKNLFNIDGLLLAKKDATGKYVQFTGDSSNADAVEAGLRDGSLYLVKAATLQTQNPQTITFDESYASNGSTNSIFNSTAGSNQPVPPSSTSWELVDWRDSTSIMDELDTSDDQTAQANYEQETKELDYKESKLDVEMNNIQTEHTAVTNEMDSVKKIMTKNEEDSFKYFS